MYKLKKRLSNRVKQEILSFVHKSLIEDLLWEEYTEYDLALYLMKKWDITYEKATDAIVATKFIIKLEKELLHRKEVGTLCDCVPLLSPYLSPIKTLCYLDEVPYVIHKATPYTSLGLASIAAIRLARTGQFAKYGQGIPIFIADYMRKKKVSGTQAVLHVNMRYKNRLCMDKYKVVHALYMTKFMTDLRRHFRFNHPDEAYFVRTPSRREKDGQSNTA